MTQQAERTDSGTNAPSDKKSWGASALVLLYTFTIFSLVGGVVLWSIHRLPLLLSSAILALWTVLGAIVLFFSKLLGEETTKSLLKRISEGLRNSYKQAYHGWLFSILGTIMALLVSTLLYFYPLLFADPYIHKGTLALNDSLQSNRQGYVWDVKGGRCEFNNGQYQVSEPQENTFYPCVAHATNYSNFVFQVEMTITQGDCGAVILRRNEETEQQYFFRICQDSSFMLIRYDAMSAGGQQWHKLDSQLSNPAIQQGLNQTNVIAVVADGTSIDLWVNDHKISSVVDTAYKEGRIGFAANDLRLPTTVMFRNAKVWTF